MPTPIGLLVDDSCPLAHVYLCHRADAHGERDLVDDLHGDGRKTLADARLGAHGGTAG